MNFHKIEDILSKICKKKTILFKELNTESKGILLRHDIDESLNFAYEIFKKELDFGVKSTFFVMLTNPLYNPLSNKNKKILKNIIENGFEVGLHFDTSIYKEDEIENFFLNEINLLEDILESKVYSYSIHQPSVTGCYYNNNHFINAYSPKIFNDELYISDSNFSFKEKDIYEFIEKSNNQIIQILLHPDHFITNGVKSYKIVHQKLISDFNFEVMEFYKENLLFKKHLKF